MDLSGTLINSQLLIMASALPPVSSSTSSLHYSFLRSARFRETYDDDDDDDDGTIVRGVTMRCQQDRGHIFPGYVIINNYLPKCAEVSAKRVRGKKEGTLPSTRDKMNIQLISRKKKEAQMN